MNSSKQIEQFIQDAEDNYQNGRIKDALNHFNEIMNFYFESSQIDKAIYFGYRSTLCRTILESDIDYLDGIMNLGVKLIKFGLSETQKLLDGEIDPWEKVKLLNSQHKTIKSIDFSDELNLISEYLIGNYKIILGEITLSNEEKIAKLEKIIELLTEQENLKEKIMYENQLMQLLIGMADEMPENDLEVFRKHQLYNQALTLSKDEEISEKLNNKISSLLKIIEKI